MRTMIGITMAAALVGCSAQDSVALDYRAELNTQARGVELSADGLESNVGMYSTTCDVNTSYAGMGEDYDYGDSDEVVVDGEFTTTGDTYLVVTPDGIGITTPAAYPYQASFGEAGIVAAELMFDGFVTVTPVGDDCSVAMHSADGATTSLTQLGVECDQQSSIATNTDTGMTWVSTDSGVFQVADGEVLRVSEMPNALLSHDAASDAVYAAVAGQSTVVALEPGGFERWSTQVDGAVTALTDMGSAASAAVSIQTNVGGEFVVLDGQTGEVTSDVPTPSAASDIDVSANGEVLAFTLPTAVHYFDLITVD